MPHSRRHPNVVNLAELEPRSNLKGKKFGAAMKHLGFATGAHGVGCTWYEVEPGRAAFPRHYHCANEEAIFVLEGQGTLRIGDATVELRAGDYATLPVGPSSAHQFRNTGTAPLRYLCFSTLALTDVVGYPDSKKVAALAWPSMEEGLKGKFWARLVMPESAGVDYYEGEDAG